MKRDIQIKQLSIYPLPSRENIKISGGNPELTQYTIFDTFGNRFTIFKVNGFWDISGLPNGLYYLLDNKNKLSGRLIKS